MQLALVPGQVAIEAVARVAVVLGLVDDPRLRVDRAGLVNEAAHRLDRDRLDGRGRARRNLEDVAVLGPVPLLLADRVLLAREPGAPGGDAAVAVVVGPVQDEGAADQLAAAGIEVRDGDPALCDRVVGVSRALRASLLEALLVADDPDAVALALEIAGAVVAGRGRQAVGHGRAGAPEADVVEPLRQREILALLDLQRSVALAPGEDLARRRRAPRSGPRGRASCRRPRRWPAPPPLA